MREGITKNRLGAARSAYFCHGLSRRELTLSSAAAFAQTAPPVSHAAHPARPAAPLEPAANDIVVTARRRLMSGTARAIMPCSRSIRWAHPGFTIVNAGAGLTLPEDRVSFAVIGDNLTSRIYATIAQDKVSGSGEVVRVAAEPRAVNLQVELNF